MGDKKKKGPKLVEFSKWIAENSSKEAKVTYKKIKSEISKAKKRLSANKKRKSQTNNIFRLNQRIKDEELIKQIESRNINDIITQTEKFLGNLKKKIEIQKNKPKSQVGNMSKIKQQLEIESEIKGLKEKLQINFFDLFLNYRIDRNPIQYNLDEIFSYDQYQTSIKNINEYIECNLDYDLFSNGNNLLFYKFKYIPNSTKIITLIRRPVFTKNDYEIYEIICDDYNNIFQDITNPTKLDSFKRLKEKKIIIVEKKTKYVRVKKKIGNSNIWKKYQKHIKRIYKNKIPKSLKKDSNFKKRKRKSYLFSKKKEIRNGRRLKPRIYEELRVKFLKLMNRIRGGKMIKDFSYSRFINNLKIRTIIKINNNLIAIDLYYLFLLLVQLNVDSYKLFLEINRLAQIKNAKLQNHRVPDFLSSNNYLSIDSLEKNSWKRRYFDSFCKKLNQGSKISNYPELQFSNKINNELLKLIEVNKNNNKISWICRLPSLSSFKNLSFYYCFIQEKLKIIIYSKSTDEYFTQNGFKINDNEIRWKNPIEYFTKFGSIDEKDLKTEPIFSQSSCLSNHDIKLILIGISGIFIFIFVCRTKTVNPFAFVRPQFEGIGPILASPISFVREPVKQVPKIVFENSKVMVENNISPVLNEILRSNGTIRIFTRFPLNQTKEIQSAMDTVFEKICRPLN